MVFNPDLAEIVAEGFNAALETTAGDKCLHFASNPRGWAGRSNSTKSPESAKSSESTSTSRPDRTRTSKASDFPRESYKSSESERRRRSQRDDRRYHDPKSDRSERSRSYYQQSKPHQQRQSPNEPRSSRDQAPTNDWSRRSPRQARGDQQQQQQYTIDANPRPFAKEDFEKQPNKQNHEPPRLVDPRHDSFRLAKSAYMPPPPQQAVPRMMWDEAKLHDDVGRAVQEAMRRSKELGRGKS